MQIIAFDLEAAAVASNLSKRSLQYAIDNDLLVVHYGGEKNSKPLIKPADLERYVDSLPTSRPKKVA